MAGDVWYTSTRCTGEGIASTVPMQLQVRSDRLLLRWGKGRPEGKLAGVRYHERSGYHRREGQDRHRDGPTKSGMRVDPIPRDAVSGADFLPYPARHPQRRGARRTASARSRRTGWRPGKQCAFRRSSSTAKPRDDAPATQKDRAFLKSITLYEDADVLVLNKPMGLAVQGGSGTVRHIDGMLEALRDAHGQRPRLVHRLDKDTAGCLVVAKTRFAAAASPRPSARAPRAKIYWALVVGVPKPRQGRISTYLAKEEREDELLMRIAKHGEAARAMRSPITPSSRRRATLIVGAAQAGDRPHPSVARAHGPYRPPDRRRPEIWARELGAARRHAEQAASVRAPDRVPHPRGGGIDVTAPLPRICSNRGTCSASNVGAGPAGHAEQRLLVCAARGAVLERLRRTVRQIRHSRAVRKDGRARTAGVPVMRRRNTGVGGGINCVRGSGVGSTDPEEPRVGRSHMPVAPGHQPPRPRDVVWRLALCSTPARWWLTEPGSGVMIE